MKAFYFLLFMVLATAGFSVSNFALSEEEATKKLDRPEACSAGPYACAPAIVSKVLQKSMDYEFGYLSSRMDNEESGDLKAVHLEGSELWRMPSLTSSTNDSSVAKD